MIILELPPEQSVILAGIRRQRREEARRTGLHVSSIISDMLLTTDPSREKYKSIDEVSGLGFQEIGNALEDAVAIQLARRIPGWVKPAPRTRRGITGSPDGWSPRAKAIDEIKACWAHDRDFLDTDARRGGLLYGAPIEESIKFIGYKWQVLFYMKLFDAIRGRIHVLFVNGSGRPPFPKPRTFLLKPTTREIDDNFDMIHQHAMDVPRFRKMLRAA